MKLCLLFFAVALAVVLDSSEAQVRTCLHATARDCSVVRCASVDAGQCASGKTVKCGCCDTCIVQLEKGATCESFAPTNARCGPGLVCNGGMCLSEGEYVHIGYGGL